VPKSQRYLSIPRKRKEHNQNKICILYFRKNNASRSLSGMRSCSQETSFRLVGFCFNTCRALLSGNSELKRKSEERGETVALTEDFAVCFCFEQKRKKQLIKGQHHSTGYWLVQG